MEPSCGQDCKRADDTSAICDMDTFCTTEELLKLINQTLSHDTSSSPESAETSLTSDDDNELSHTSPPLGGLSFDKPQENQRSEDLEETTKTPINWHTKPYDLPPCRVCGAKGTGFHYGVNTCEPCKTFFRRALKRCSQLKCKKNSKCIISPSNGSLCSKCRFQKCLEAGMSTEGIRFGRYSFDKIVKDTKEVKLRKAEECMALHESHDPERLKAIRELTDAVTQSADKYITLACELDQAIHLEMHTLTLTKDDATWSVFEDMINLMQGDDNVVFYNRLFHTMGQIVQKLVKFIKGVPGFRQLPMDDQINLVKSAIPDLRFLMIFNRIDVERGMMGNMHLHQAIGADFAERATKMTRRLQILQLTRNELALLNALVVFLSDRCDNLKEQDKIDAIKENLLEALLHLFSENHTSDKLIFPKLISALVEMRSFGKRVKQFLTEVIQKNQDTGAIQVPSLLLEMLLW